MEMYSAVTQNDISVETIIEGDDKDHEDSEKYRLTSLETPNGDLETQNTNVVFEMNQPKPLIYRVSQVPPFHLLFFFALQQSLLSIGSPLAVTIIVAEVVCTQHDEAIKAYILSASFLMIGLSTIAMSIFGVRLPIFQGPAPTYLIPLIAMVSLPEWQCPNLLIGSQNTTLLIADNITTSAREVTVNKLGQVIYLFSPWVNILNDFE